MAIIDRIGYYTVFEDGHIVKGKEWYPLVTESDFLNQEIKLDKSKYFDKPEPVKEEFEFNIWGQVIGRRFLYRKEDVKKYNRLSDLLAMKEQELNEERKKELKKFVAYREKRLKEIQKAYLLQEKKKYTVEKKYRNRLKKRIQEYRAYLATQSKTFNIFGMKITYTPKKVAPKAKVIQKRVIKAFGRSIEIER